MINTRKRRCNHHHAIVLLTVHAHHHVRVSTRWIDQSPQLHAIRSRRVGLCHHPSQRLTAIGNATHFCRSILIDGDAHQHQAVQTSSGCERRESDTTRSTRICRRSSVVQHNPSAGASRSAEHPGRSRIGVARSHGIDPVQPRIVRWTAAGQVELLHQAWDVDGDGNRAVFKRELGILIVHLDALPTLHPQRAIIHRLPTKAGRDQWATSENTSVATGLR